MQIKPVYSAEMGSHLEFIPDTKRDKKSLRDFAHELQSAGMKCSFISVNNNIIEMRVPCQLWHKPVQLPAQKYRGKENELVYWLDNGIVKFETECKSICNSCYTIKEFYDDIQSGNLFPIT